MVDVVDEYVDLSSGDRGDLGDRASREIYDTARSNLIKLDPKIQKDIDYVERYRGSSVDRGPGMLVEDAQRRIDAATQSAYDANPNLFLGLMTNTGTTQAGITPGQYTMPNKPTGPGMWEWNGEEWVSLGVEGR